MYKTMYSYIHVDDNKCAPLPPPLEYDGRIAPAA